MMVSSVMQNTQIKNTRDKSIPAPLKASQCAHVNHEGKLACTHVQYYHTDMDHYLRLTVCTFHTDCHRCLRTIICS